MNCIIIDDDATARLIIKQLCIKNKEITVLEKENFGLSEKKIKNIILESI